MTASSCLMYLHHTQLTLLHQTSTSGFLIHVPLKSVSSTAEPEHGHAQPLNTSILKTVCLLIGLIAGGQGVPVQRAVGGQAPAPASTTVVRRRRPAHLAQPSGQAPTQADRIQAAQPALQVQPGHVLWPQLPQAPVLADSSAAPPVAPFAALPPSPGRSVVSRSIEPRINQQQ